MFRSAIVVVTWAHWLAGVAKACDRFWVCFGSWNQLDLF